jgi:hypothetical protein
MKLEQSAAEEVAPQASITEIFADRYFVASFAVAVMARVAVFLALIWFPLLNEINLPISPLHYQTGVDFALFEDSRRALFETDFGQIVEGLSQLMFNSSAESLGVIRPVLPVILQLTGYAPGNTLPLAVLYLVISVVWLFFWMRWCRGKSMGRYWLLGFGLLPVPIFWSINISSDLLFAVFVGGFFLAFESTRYRWAFLFLVLGVLTRPNGLSLPLFLVLYFALVHGELPVRMRCTVVAVCGVLGIGALPFVWNDLYNFALYSDQKLLLGYTQVQLLSGVFDQLPTWINLPASWLSLLGVKMAFFVGLRPSFSDTGLFLVLVRSAAGLILFPGLIWSFLFGSNTHRLFLLCFMAPIFLGLVQERYMLPILPIIYYYGTVALQDIWRFSGKRIGFGAGNNSS